MQKLLCFLAYSVAVIAQSRDDRWRQDLTALATQLPAVHPNLFFQTPRSEFERAVRDLDARIPILSDSEVVTALARVTALAGDSHTALFLPQARLGWRRLPIGLRWFGPELRVTAASEPFRQTLGARVLRIGDLPADAALEAIGTVIPHENDDWLRFLSPSYLVTLEILQALRIAPPGPAVSFQFIADTGDTVTLDVPSFAAAEVPPRVSAPDPSAGPLPLYRQSANLNYWYRYLPDDRLLYIKYSVCQNDPARPFPEFAQEVLALFDSRPVEKFVVDFRGNTGGDSSVINPLFQGMVARQARFGPNLHVYAIIDGGVFSSGLLNAAVFVGQPSATIVGENSGGKPQHFGNVRSFNLPNSGLAVQHSTVLFASPLTTDSLVPAVHTPLTPADFFARHDPALAAILAGDTSSPAPQEGTMAIVNAATFRAGTPLAPGTLATAFGEFPGAGTASASAIPLPTALGNIRVLVGDTPAPLLATQRRQINFQLPGSAAGRQRIRVEQDGRLVVAETTIDIAGASPGIFSISASDTERPGAILNQDFRFNSRENPAREGGIVQIFATGPGAVDPPVADGVPGSAGLLSRTKDMPRIYVASERAEVLFSGMSTQFPGLWQINAMVPRGVRGRVPVFAIIGNRASNGVTLWVAP